MAQELNHGFADIAEYTANPALNAVMPNHLQRWRRHLEPGASQNDQNRCVIVKISRLLLVWLPEVVLAQFWRPGLLCGNN